MSLLIFMCVCGWPLLAMLSTVPPTRQNPPTCLQSMSQLPIEATAGQRESVLSASEAVRSKQAVFHWEMHNYTQHLDVLKLQALSFV